MIPQDNLVRVQGMNELATKVVDDSHQQRLGMLRCYQIQQQFLLLQQQQHKLLNMQMQLARQSQLSQAQSMVLAGQPYQSTQPARKQDYRRKQVKFSEDVLCYSNVRDYKEIISSWYSKNELTAIRSERRNLVRELKRVNFDLKKLNRSSFHLRGLEPFLSLGFNKHMQKKRSQVLQTVLVVQKKQRQKGIRDAEALRAACCEASSWARDRAFTFGQKDAKVASAVASRNHDIYGCSERSKEAAELWENDSEGSLAPSVCSTESASTDNSSSSASLDDI